MGLLGINNDDPASAMKKAMGMGVPIPGVPENPSPSPVAAPPPIKPAVNLPPVQSPQTVADQSELKRLQDTGSGISQLQKKHGILGSLLRIPEAIGNVVAPWATAYIPGTEMHHRMLLGSQRDVVNQDIQNDERMAQGSEAQARADALAHPAPKEPSNAFELWHQQNPNGTIQDWQKIQPDKSDAAINSPQAGYARAIADAIANGRDPVSDPHVMAWKQAVDDSAKQKEPNRDDKAIAIMSKPKEQWTPEEQAYMKGYGQYVDMNKVQPGVQRMIVANDPKWESIKIQREKMVAPYVQTAMDAMKVDDLAERIMRDVQSRGGNITGPEFMQLLSYHMAGTIGATKNMRGGIEMLQEHVSARPWSEALEAMYNAAKNGGNVSMKQAQEWVQLARDRQQVMLKQADQANKLYGANLDLNSISPAGGGENVVEFERGADGKLHPVKKAQ